VDPKLHAIKDTRAEEFQAFQLVTKAHQDVTIAVKQILVVMSGSTIAIHVNLTAARLAHKF